MMRPNYGVITCIGREHLEFFGDLAGVAQEEGWLAELLPAEGKLFVNGDEPLAGALTERTRAGGSPGRIARPAMIGAHADCVSTRRVSSISGGWADAPILRASTAIKLLGRHQVVNALFAHRPRDGTGAEPRGQSPGDWTSASRRRCGWSCGKPGACACLDDTYNANADSVEAACKRWRSCPAKAGGWPCWATWLSWGPQRSGA